MRKTIRKSPILTIIFLVAAVSLAAEVKYPCEGDKAPLFVLRNMEGMMVSLNLMCGDKIPPTQRKTIVLDFFQVTCKPCIEELPAIKKFYAAWKDDERVKFYMVGVGETPENMREFQEKYALTEIPALYDSYLVTFRNFGFNTFPVAMIIDRDRTIRLIVKNKQPKIDEILTQCLNKILAAP